MMDHLAAAIVTAISPAALPLVVTILGCAFIYLKIQSQRKATRGERDSQRDEIDKRLTLVEHDVEFMKEQNQIFSSKLDRILDELTAIKVSLAKKADI